MDAVMWEARKMSGNPIFPYRWIARYDGGGELKQFDVDGYHYSHEIDRARLTELVVLGHKSPIKIPTLWKSSERPLEDVIIKAQVDIEYELGSKRVVAYKVAYHFGYQYGQDLFLVEIDDNGKVWKLPLVQLGQEEGMNGGKSVLV